MKLLAMIVVVEKIRKKQRFEHFTHRSLATSQAYRNTLNGHQLSDKIPLHPRCCSVFQLVADDSLTDVHLHFFFSKAVCKYPLIPLENPALIDRFVADKHPIWAVST
jgi:hypothetical protein